jgi:hypothetical protein
MYSLECDPGARVTAVTLQIQSHQLGDILGLAESLHQAGLNEDSADLFRHGRQHGFPHHMSFLEGKGKRHTAAKLAETGYQTRPPAVGRTGGKRRSTESLIQTISR